MPLLGYHYAHRLVLLGARERPPAVHLTATQQAKYREFADRGPETFVVLGYQDLTTQSRSHGGRTVAAAEFASQLAMLKAAGFASLSARDVTGLLAGTSSVPRHAVLICFDGGRERDWSVADRILQRYGYSAVVFIDPNHIADRRSGYLSWTQLSTMTSSGRWSVGLDITGADVAADIDGNGTRGPVVVEHTWLASRHRPESTEEYQNRIRGTLHKELAATDRHGLPRPRLVSYPFDIGYPLARVNSQFAELSTVVNSTVGAGILSMQPDTPVTTTYRTERLLPRIPVYAATTTDLLFSRIRAAAS